MSNYILLCPHYKIQSGGACRTNPKYPTCDFNKHLIRFPQSAAGVYVIQYECSMCPSVGAASMQSVYVECVCELVLVQLVLRVGVDTGECRTPEHTVEPSGGVVG